MQLYDSTQECNRVQEKNLVKLNGKYQSRLLKKIEVIK